MRRREWLAGAAASLGSRSAWSQGGARRPLVGVLLVGPLTAGMSAQTVATVRGELARLGFPDGERITLEVSSADGDPSRLEGLAQDLLRRQAAIICAFGPAAVRAARAATSTLPIVALDLETDPVRAGWVASFAAPGGNVTGLFQDLAALAGKWLELLRTAAPHARRIAVLWDSTTGSEQLDAVREVGLRWQLQLEVVSFASTAELVNALRAFGRARADAMVMLSSPTVRNSSRELADFVRQARLPAISPFRPFAEFGGLMAYGPDLTDFFRRCAGYVAKLLAGARAGDLPIEQPTRFELVLNAAAARDLGLALPQELLVRADAVLQ